jgi:acetyltransferase-like isoleucine patch superfamily enzyme
MKQLGGHYLSLEELRAAGFSRIGKNVKIHSKASIYGLENIEIGDHVRIDDFTVIIATGKLVIGDYVSIPNFCFLGAKNGISLGNFVTLAPGVKIFSASDDYHGDRLTGVAVPAEMTGGKHAPVDIEDHVLMGAGSVVLPGCRIGTGVAIGALSLVKTDLEAWGVYAGVPVVRLKDRKRGLLGYAQKILTE